MKNSLTKNILFAFVLTITIAIFSSFAFAAGETEPNNTISNATSVQLNQENTGSLSSSSDIDYYVFTLTQDGYISLSLRHDYADTSSLRWVASLYNASNNELCSYDYAVGNIISTYYEPELGLAAGTYYIKISSYYSSSYSSVPYYFTIDYVSDSKWEKEFNETILQADEISLNNEFFGSLRTSDDRDYYKFVLPEDGYVSLTLKHEYTDTSSLRWIATLYNESHEEFFNISFNEGNITSPVNSYSQGFPAGIYYIEVSSYYSSSYSRVPYSVMINYTPSENWETEFNNSLGRADIISTDTTINGSLMTNGDVDYYTFNLASDDNIKLSLSHNYANTSSLRWVLTLLNEYNNTLGTYNYKVGEDTSELITNNINLSAGKYYVRVDSYYSSSFTSAKYSFKINTKADKTYTIKYNANGGSGAPGDQAKKHGQDLTLSPIIPTRYGYTFVGWAKKANAVAAVYRAGGLYGLNENVTLYAVWSSNESSSAIKGDVNGDNTVDNKDLVMLARMIVGLN